ncbi:MAG: methyl-accepting chemotaxis protein [Methylophilaceae bacterium]|nr:methyl-accepting chemotaxis protein [Methylophilaceae bacterium]
MSPLIDMVSGSIRNKLLLITGSGTTMLLSAALFGLWLAWQESLILPDDQAAKFQNEILFTLGLMAAAIVIAFVVFLWLVQRNIIGPARQLERDLRRLAQGDFSQPIIQTTQDEIGQVAASAEQIRKDLGAIVDNVKHATARVGEAATALADTASTIVQGSQHQKTAADTAAQTMEHVTRSISAVAENADEVRRLSSSSLEQSRIGNEQLAALLREMQNTIASMQQVAQSVGQFVENMATISHMTQQVKDIADQTNLLALNAAIEAARAGEFGRGFAVVADEVRKLAEKSAQAANEIDGVTRAINAQSSEVTDTLARGQKFLESSEALTVQAAAALERTRDAAMHTNEGVDNITQRVREQNVASEEISRLVEQIAVMAEDNSNAIQHAAEAARHLVELAENLEATVSRFRI